MKTSLKIQDLDRNTAMDRKAMSAVKGGVAAGFLFRAPLRGASAPAAPVLNQHFNIDDINFVYNVSNTYIDKFLQQTNNLSQINLTEVIAIDSSVDVSVDQGQLGINS